MKTKIKLALFLFTTVVISSCNPLAPGGTDNVGNPPPPVINPDKIR